MLNRYHWLTLFVLFSSTSALAVQSVNVQTYNPSTSTKFVILEDALRTEWPNLGKYYLGMNYNYVQDPLVATDLKRIGQVTSIISSIQTVDMFVGYKPDKQLALYFGLPIHTVTYTFGNPLLVSGTNTVAGDAKLMAKVRLNHDDDNTDVAVIPEFHLPTGNTENFVSDASTYIAMRLAIERVFEKFTLGINGGFAVAQNATYETIDMRKRIIFGIGGFMPFNDNWGANFEFHAQIPVPFNNYLNPNEAYAGLRYATSENFALTGGASVGKISGSTGQNFRMIAGLRYSIPEDQAAPAPSRPAYGNAPVYAAPAAAAPAATPFPTPSSPKPVQQVVTKPPPSPSAPVAIPTLKEARMASPAVNTPTSTTTTKSPVKNKKKLKKKR